MRIIPFIVSAAICSGLVVVLNTTLVAPAPLGKLLSPQHGIWQNAEPADEKFSADLKFPQLAGKTEVYFDERLVPHVFAEQENDAYFVQGYLHAKFRLWQMDMQTHLAAGRVSEIAGEKGLDFDREFRRLGMAFAAEISQQEVEKDQVMKAECDAYTAGVNAYIESLTESRLPVEYKLMGFKPEKWSNLKTALFLKLMSWDLAAHEDDFEMTNAKSFFNGEDFAKLFPAIQDSLDPVIPKGTAYPTQKIFPKAPANADSFYLNNKDLAIEEFHKPDPENGSNNWAVSGKKTRSGAPILCNDPHLGLNLPSLWFEIQLSTPEFNAYGVSFPGSPGVIIGYNDSCAFGFTNGGRDVRDYYNIKFKDDSRTEYLYNGAYHPTRFRVEIIKIRDKPDYVDSVAYVQLGNDWCPVMYDKSFGGKRNTNSRYYAVRWKAHDPSNELKIFNRLDRAKNYADYSNAVINLHTPGQNAAFACKNGDIAIRTQGDWPAKWKGQGDYIMPGSDSSYLWQGMIPQDEVPFLHNPERSFISSANQKPVGENYPYYLGRDYPMYRGLYINKRLTAMNDITPKDMMELQTDNYDIFAAIANPLFVRYMKQDELGKDERHYFDLLKNWDIRDDVGSKGATVFEILWKNFADTVFNDEYAKAPKPIMHPYESTLVEALLKDTAFKFLDDINTPHKETLSEDVTAAFKRSCMELKKIEADGKLDWEKYKATHLTHLARILVPLNRMNLPVGGGTHCINAAKPDHGPSWRMVVSLTKETEAYGVYPGGQSGNPGSKYYDNFVDQWVAGKYYPLWMMKKGEEKDKRVIAKMTFNKN